MNYELALKEAGFKSEDPYFWVEEYKPSLSELIEACGDITFSLCTENIPAPNGLVKEWVCFGNRIIRRGKTPEEAVAILWLELNKK